MSHYETTASAQVDAVYEPPDELTQREIEEALTIMRAIKRRQRGYMLVSPTVGDGRALYIVGPLDKQRAA